MNNICSSNGLESKKLVCNSFKSINLIKSIDKISQIYIFLIDF